MAFPAAVAGPWLCLLLLLGVPLTLGTSIAGGLHNVSVSDPEVQKAAHAAEQTYNQRSKSPYYSKGLQVLSAQKQVVSGIMIHLTMELVETLCRKKQDGVMELKKCLLPSPSQQKKVRCNFQIWSQTWLKKTQIDQQCNSVSH